MPILGTLAEKPPAADQPGLGESNPGRLHLCGSTLSAANILRRSKHTGLSSSITVVTVKSSATYASSYFLVLAFGELLFVLLSPSVFSCLSDIFPRCLRRRRRLLCGFFLAVGKQQIGAIPPPTDLECRFSRTLTMTSPGKPGHLVTLNKPPFKFH